MRNRRNNEGPVAEAVPMENIEDGAFSEIKASVAQYQQTQLKPATGYFVGAVALGAAGVFSYYNLSALAALVPAVGVAACVYKVDQHINNFRTKLEDWWRDNPDLAPSPEAQRLYPNLTQEQKLELQNVAIDAIGNWNSQMMDFKAFFKKGLEELEGGGSLQAAVFNEHLKVLPTSKNSNASAEVTATHVNSGLMGEQNAIVSAEQNYLVAEVTPVPAPRNGAAGQLQQQPQQQR